MSADEGEGEGRQLPVCGTRNRGMRTVTFTLGGRQYAGIEQNPDKPSCWGGLPAAATRSSSSRMCRRTLFVWSEWTARQGARAARIRRGTGLEGCRFPLSGTNGGR